MVRSQGRLTALLILAVALAGCQPIADTTPLPVVDDSGVNGTNMKEEDAKLSDGETDLIGQLPDDYGELRARQGQLDAHERKLLEEHVGKAIAEFRDKGSSMLRATLEGIRQAKEDGYDLAPLCSPGIFFNKLPNHSLSKLFKAGMNQFDVDFDIPHFARSDSCEGFDIIIFVNVVATRARKTVNSSGQNLNVKKEVLLIYYMVDVQEKSLTKGTFLYNPPNKDGNRTYPLSAGSQDIDEFEDKSVRVPLWEVIGHFIETGSSLKEQEVELQYDRNDPIDVFMRAWFTIVHDADAERAITCIDPQNSIDQGNNSGLRSPNTGGPSPGKLMESIVYIYNPRGGPQGDGGSGTGFYIRDDLVLTNYHVIKNSLIVNMHKKDGAWFEGVVIGYDKRRDLALVQAQQDGTAMVIHDGGLPDLGSEVSAYGHPMGFKFTYTRGVISNYMNTNWRYPNSVLPVRYIQTDTATNRGNSGGPLVHADRVIGVNTWSRLDDPDRSVQGLHFAIRYDEIHAFLKQQGVDVSDDSGNGPSAEIFGCGPSS